MNLDFTQGMGASGATPAGGGFGGTSGGTGQGGDLFGALVGSLIGTAGSMWQTHEQEMRWREQLKYETQMSNTAFQRQVKDLQAAGLNPMMAYGKMSGASTPSVGTGEVAGPNVAQNMQAAFSSANQLATVKKAAEETTLLQRQQALTDAQTQQSKAAAQRETSSANQLDFQTLNLMPEELKQQIIKSQIADATIEAEIRTKIAKMTTDEREAWLKEHTVENEAARIKAQREKTEYELPGAKRTAEMYQSPLGKDMPIIERMGPMKDAAHLGNIIGEMVRTWRNSSAGQAVREGFTSRPGARQAAPSQVPVF